jgi:hypothetical protein
MKKKNYSTKENRKIGVIDFCQIKALLLFAVFFAITVGAQAQSHDHDDTMIVLNRNDFSLTIKSSSLNLLQLEIVSSLGDTIQPLFVEFSASGFEFSNDCIIQQSINSSNVVSNIEKIWGPAFVALGIGVLPPFGNYQSDLAIVNGMATGSYIRVKIFGTLNGQDFVWDGSVKN